MFNLLISILFLLILILILLTIRAIVPRYKTDILINIIWKISLPLVLFDILYLVIFFI